MTERNCIYPDATTQFELANSVAEGMLVDGFAHQSTKEPKLTLGQIHFFSAKYGLWYRKKNSGEYEVARLNLVNKPSKPMGYEFEALSAKDWVPVDVASEYERLKTLHEQNLADGKHQVNGTKRHRPPKGGGTGRQRVSTKKLEKAQEELAETQRELADARVEISRLRDELELKDMEHHELNEKLVAALLEVKAPDSVMQELAKLGLYEPVRTVGINIAIPHGTKLTTEVLVELLKTRTFSIAGS